MRGLTQEDVLPGTLAREVLAFVRGMCEEGREVRTTLTAFADGNDGPPVPVETLHSASFNANGTWHPISPPDVGGAESLAGAVETFCAQWRVYAEGKDGWDIVWRRLPEIELDTARGYAIRMRLALVEPAPKPVSVTQADIEALVRDAQYHVFPDTTTTVCCLRLHNGFCLVGTSACVDPANFDAAQGEAIAYEKALSQVWALEGYRLRCEMAGGDRTAAA